MRADQTRSRTPVHAVWGIVAVCFLLALPALAQDPVVTAADPPSAEQETYDLDVMVSGDNFGTDPVVDFLVSGTENPGGIRVKNVKRQGPKNLKVTIDVDADAVLDDFDIRVMSRGRTGKGIELFRVTEKTTGPDTTPPGNLDLQLVAEKYGSVVLSFTMPADDGYDPTSGPVVGCVVRGGEMSSQGCTEDWVQPLATQPCIVRGLRPETSYTIRVSCVDDAENWSPEATIPVTTGRFADFKDPSWTVEEVPFGVDGLIGHAIHSDGTVWIAGMVGLWDQWSPKGKPSLVPTVIRVITGIPNETGWSWSFEDVPGFANRLVMGPWPWTRPAFVGQRSPDAKSNEEELTFVFHDGAGWVTESVATTGTPSTRPPRLLPPGLAFDPTSVEPAIAWCSPGSPAGVRLARRISAGVWEIETITSSCRADGWGSQVEIAFDGEGHSALLYQDGLGSDGPFEVRFLRESGASWSEEIVTTRQQWGRPGYLPRLVYDPARGDFTIASEGNLEMAWNVEICDRGLGTWSCDVRAFLGGRWEASIEEPQPRHLGSDWLTADEAGEIVVAYTSEAEIDATVARRLPGQSAWTIEHVDHPTEHALPPSAGNGGWKEGPYMAVDPDGLPTLTYTWHVGERDAYPPTEYHLYFAWKTP